MFEFLNLILIEFIVTYFVLSTTFLGCVWALNQCKALGNRSIAEAAWKLAFWSPFLVAGFLTFHHRSSDISSDTNRPSNAPTSIAISKPIPLTLPAASPTPISPAPLSTNRTLPLTVSQPISLNDNISHVGHFSSPVPQAEQARPSGFSIPSNFQLYVNLLACLWLSFVLIIFVRFAIRISLLNREVNRYPEYQTESHIVSVERKFPRLKNKIQIKLTEAWKSPIVAPNNIICIPDWAERTLSTQQLEVMIAHEAAHIVRRDPALSIAYRFLSCAFFFQPMNRIAERALSELAELACDEMASSSPSEKRSLAEALFVCASAQKNSSDLPHLALAMAKPNSPLLARVGALIESAPTPPARHAKLAYGAGIFVVLTMSFCIPGIQVSFAKMPKPSSFDIPRLPPQISKENSQRIAANQESQRSEKIDILGKDFTADVATNKQESKNEESKNEESKNEKRVEQAYDKEKTVFASLIHSQSQNKDLSSPLDKTEEVQTTNDNHINHTSNKWGIEDAKLAIKAKSYNEAVEILKHLAINHDTQAQSMLGAMYWFGEGTALNLEEGEKWSRLAAAKGDHQAIKLVHTIDERIQNRNAILFFTGENQNTHFNYLENKCQQPVYNPSLFASNASVLEAWNKCAKKHLEALKTAKAQDQLIVPPNLLAILTDREIKKAEENSLLVIDRAIESIAANKAEMQRGLQAWNEAHPNLITNAPFIPANKIPEPVTRTSEYRVSLPPMILKQTP
jgi:beta-lactamase regulating signal transducer with metallopeptidase domain/TPR repeat protein